MKGSKTDRPGSRKLGMRIEDKACQYLERTGYRIVHRNFISPYGEIDIIAMDETVLVFVEVRYRRPGSLVTSVESLEPRKIRKLKLAIRDFLSAGFRILGYGFRYDGMRVDLCAASGSPDRPRFQLIKDIIEFQNC